MKTTISRHTDVMFHNSLFNCKWIEDDGYPSPVSAILNGYDWLDCWDEVTVDRFTNTLIESLKADEADKKADSQYDDIKFNQRLVE